MIDPYKLFRVMLIGLIGIVLLSGCRETAPGPCSVIVANNPSNYTLSVLFDGQMHWNKNFPPDHVWIKDGLEDGTIHEIVVYTTDPSIFKRTYRVRVVAGKTFVYGDYEGNAIVRIGGSVSDAAMTPDTQSTR